MAKQLVGTAVKINSVELTDHVASTEVGMSVADVETTNMASTGMERIAGLRSDSFGFNLHQDFASGEVDATLWPLFNGGSAFLVEVWGGYPASTVTSATNPKYSGTVILTEYPPISGAPGDLASTAISLPVSGTISRATA